MCSPGPLGFRERPQERGGTEMDREGTEIEDGKRKERRRRRVVRGWAEAP